MITISYDGTAYQTTDGKVFYGRSYYTTDPRYMIVVGRLAKELERAVRKLGWANIVRAERERKGS